VATSELEELRSGPAPPSARPLDLPITPVRELRDLHAVRVPRAMIALLWTITLGTVTATVCFGWHYLLDDAAGVLIAFAALAVARALGGFDLRARAAA